MACPVGESKGEFSSEMSGDNQHGIGASRSVTALNNTGSWVQPRGSGYKSTTSACVHNLMNFPRRLHSDFNTSKAVGFVNHNNQ
jgi:hypothetical protein